MKLLSCYIENFGKLKDCRYNFAEGLTSFCEPNGYGKTTLAAFIKAMFYGLDTVRANSRELGERKRYYPFGGGKFGGSLTFFAGGSTFRIERFFDERSGTRDTVAVYRDGRPFNGFGEDIGGAVFGLDRQSFERTVFIANGDAATRPTGNIAARLNAFAEGTQGDGNTEKALAAIERAAKKYKKSRQGGDLISAENVRIAELSQMLQNAETIAAGLPQKYARLAELNAEAESLNGKIKQAQSANVAAADRESYERMKGEADRLEQRLREGMGAYPKGIPVREEAERAIVCAEERAKLEAKIGQGITAEDMARHAALAEQFRRGVPDGDTLERAALSIKKLTSAEAAQAGGRIHADPQAQRDAEALEGMLKRYNRTQRSPRGENAVRRSAKGCIIAAVIAAAAIVCGVALIFTVGVAAGAAVAAAGVAALLVTAFLYLNGKAGGGTANREQEKISAEIAALLARYGYSCEGGIAYAAARFMQDVVPQKSPQNSRGRLETERLKTELTDFFAAYGKRGDYLSCLAELRADAGEYASLNARLAAAEGRDGQLKAELERLNAALNATLERYAVADTDGLRRAITDGERIAEMKRELEVRRQAAEKFRADRNLDSRPAAARIDADALNQRLTEVINERQRLTLRISEDEGYAEETDDIAARKREAEGRLADYRERYDILIKTAECLRQADENLKDRYVKPVRGQFGRYAEALEQALGRQVTVGADFSLTFEQGGAVRSEEHLSAGELTMCSLCLRLALTDNMYREEKPFYVLDDPFAELDEEHMGKVKKLIRELSKSVQIIYFCCHPSRKV